MDSGFRLVEYLVGDGSFREKNRPQRGLCRKKGEKMENKKCNKSLVIGGIGAVHAIAVILVVMVIAPVCNGMVETAAGKQVPMRCHYTSAVLLFLGVLLLVNSILCMVRKEMVVCGIMAIVISVLIILSLNPSVGMGICLNPEMACNFTAPFVKILGALGIVAGCVSVYLGKKIQNKD